MSDGHRKVPLWVHAEVRLAPAELDALEAKLGAATVSPESFDMAMLARYALDAIAALRAAPAVSAEDEWHRQYIMASEESARLAESVGLMAPVVDAAVCWQTAQTKDACDAAHKALVAATHDYQRFVAARLAARAQGGCNG